jgi:GNAT superfamily N-acetyltransferase
MPSWRCVLDPAIAILLGTAGGRPVAGVTLLCTGPTVHVAGVAVRPDSRGRGFGGAMTLAAVEEGRRRGCTAAALRTGPLSHPLYCRLGFVDVCQHHTYAPPAAQPA